MKNAITVDIEDWFCVHNLEPFIPKSRWSELEYRAEINTTRVLDLFDRLGVKGTFFVLGWIANRSPALVKEIERRGHEIGLHTYSHQLLDRMDEASLAGEIEKGLQAIVKAGVTQKIIGFRAPSFSVKNNTLWALDVLQQYGFRYDSSVFPVGFHPDYGMADVPLSPYEIKEGLLEVPLTVAVRMGRRIPCAGGAYFRFFPYPVTRSLLRSVNRDGRPIVFYIHPWELDASQPRVPLPFLKKIRQYHHIEKTEGRLIRLLADFEFTTIKDMLNL